MPDEVKQFIIIVLAIITAEFILCYIRPNGRDNG